MLPQDERGKCHECHEEGGACPEEGGKGVEVGRLLERRDLSSPDPQHLLLKGRLPGVQLEHLHAVEDLVHELGPLVLVSHLGQLVLLHLLGHEGVHRDQ